MIEEKELICDTCKCTFWVKKHDKYSEHCFHQCKGKLTPTNNSNTKPEDGEN